ncbi:MAG: carbon-nitrogen hydrolase family protein [Anaerolineae bacterium]
MAKLAALQLMPPAKVLARWANESGADERRLQKQVDPLNQAYDERVFHAWISYYQNYVRDQIARAGEAHAELLLLPEGTLPTGQFMRRALAERFREVARWSVEEYLAAIAPLACRYNMTIASCLYSLDGSRLVNAGILMGPNGEVIGIYYKTHLPCYEDEEEQITEAGVFAAGHEYPVFDTPVGRAGFMICYDVVFPEVARILALQGADILLHPSVGYNFPDEEEIVGEARLRVRATENSVALVYANFGGPGSNSCIVDRRGTVCASAGRAQEALALADVDLTAPRIPAWLRPGYEHREHIWRKRRPDTYGLLTELRPPILATLHEDKKKPLYHYCTNVGLP